MATGSNFGFLWNQLDREDRAEIKGVIDALLRQEKYKSKEGKTNEQTTKQEEDRKTGK